MVVRYSFTARLEGGTLLPEKVLSVGETVGGGDFALSCRARGSGGSGVWVFNTSRHVEGVWEGAGCAV